MKLIPRTDPRFELIVHVTPGIEGEVRRRLEAFANELIDLTGDVVVIQPDALANVRLLRRQGASELETSFKSLAV